MSEAAGDLLSATQLKCSYLFRARTKEDLSISPGWAYKGLSGSGESYGRSVSAIVSQGLTETYTTAKLDLSAPDVAHLSYETEPFWSDMIFVAMHPQFALWDYPGGVKLQRQALRNRVCATLITRSVLRETVSGRGARGGYFRSSG